jgi:hypothetical protein
MYESLKADLKRLEEMTRGTNTVGATVAEISSQLCQFITARIQLIELYIFIKMLKNLTILKHSSS